MPDKLLLLALLAAAYAGFALLALSQARHWRAVVGDAALPRSRVLVLRTLGAALIALSLLLAFTRDGPSFGSLLWGTAISLAALGVALTLAWHPRWLRVFARVFSLNGRASRALSETRLSNRVTAL